MFADALALESEASNAGGMMNAMMDDNCISKVPYRRILPAAMPVRKAPMMVARLF